MKQQQTHNNIFFYPTHPIKFSLLSLVTFGLYSLYWCYKCWKYIKVQEQSRIMPFWRAFFAPLWTFALASRILGPTKNWTSAGLFVGFFAMQATWRMDDPFSYLSLWSFVFLLPLVNQVNKLNADHMPATYNRFRWQHIMVSLVLAPFFIITTATQLNIIPSTQVVPGYMVYSWQKQYLHDEGGLDIGEELLYFYSTDFSMKNEGNYLTDRRVVSYWTDEETDELILLSSRFEEITDVIIEKSAAYMEPTKVTIQNSDGTEFFLVLSAENRNDRIFIKDLKARWQQAIQEQSI